MDKVRNPLGIIVQVQMYPLQLDLLALYALFCLTNLSSLVCTFIATVIPDKKDEMILDAPPTYGCLKVAFTFPENPRAVVQIKHLFVLI